MANDLSLLIDVSRQAVGVRRIGPDPGTAVLSHLFTVDPRNFHHHQTDIWRSATHLTQACILIQEWKKINFYPHRVVITNKIMHVYFS